MWFVDTEVFKEDWIGVFINPVTQTEQVIVNNKFELQRFYDQNKNDIWVMFNGRNYDQYILKAILLGFNPKEVNDWIIVKDRKGWEFSSRFNSLPMILFDVMPNPPVGLKALEGFMGENIHETGVSFDIDRHLTQVELDDTIKYCRDDVLNTIKVFMERKNEFDAQMQLVNAFNLPLHYVGKTQAQLAAVILGARKVRLKDEWEIRVPETLQINKYKSVVDWFLSNGSHDYQARLDLNIAGVPHTVAWGGLHGAISKYHHSCEPDEVFIMADVDQLYPTIMVEYNLLSRAVAQPEKFENVLATSLRLKAERKKKEREPYKRICNITYGAEGDVFNPMYDPLHRNLVCVYGQVFVIDLIEKLEGVCELIQSNTDGILVKLKRKDIDKFKSIVKAWEDRVHLHMSYDEYARVHQKDVNNYIIVPEGDLYDEKGKPRWKSKGAYVKPLGTLDYDLPIVNEAVKNYLVKRIQVEDTIYGCNDLIKFQKIVKLSRKYKWVEHECRTGNKRYDNKCYRVFASTRTGDGRILKCDGVRNPAKFASTPDHCFFENGCVRGKSTRDYPLDKEWYVTLAKSRLNDFGVSV